MTCLLCRYFQPVEPAEHRQQRENGDCQEYCGTRWNQFTAVHYIKRHGKNLEGYCHWDQDGKKVGSGYVCAGISVRETFLNENWGVRPLTPDDNLFEWAGQQQSTVLHGNWRRRETQRLEEENQTLRAQLKKSRELSKKRLEKIKAAQPAKAKKPPPIYRRGDPVGPMIPAWILNPVAANYVAPLLEDLPLPQPPPPPQFDEVPWNEEPGALAAWRAHRAAEYNRLRDNLPEAADD
jgi:hypothetical protein